MIIKDFKEKATMVDSKIITDNSLCFKSLGVYSFLLWASENTPDTRLVQLFENRGLKISVIETNLKELERKGYIDIIDIRAVGRKQNNELVDGSKIYENCIVKVYDFANRIPAF